MAWSLLRQLDVAVLSLLRAHRTTLLLVALTSMAAAIIYVLARSPARTGDVPTRGGAVATTAHFGEPSNAPGARTTKTAPVAPALPVDEAAAEVDHVAALRRGLASEDEATRASAPSRRR